MNQSAQSYEMFHRGSVDADEISPSITIRRTRSVNGSGNVACDLVYTEQLWSPINNTLVGCTEFEEWQQAEQWIIVTDESYNGLSSAMLQGCDALSAEHANVVLVDSKQLTQLLSSMNASTPTVLILATDKKAIDFCTKQFDAWMQSSAINQDTYPEMHMLWLPTSRAEQSLPVHIALEALPWRSFTILCDLAHLPTTDEAVKESMLTMLRAAIYVDAQFMFWLEGNLSAMAEPDESLHQKAIMRAARSIFAVKRRRSDEPAIPMAFTDTPALRYSQPNNEETPKWQVQARQLYLDILYAQATDNLADADADRIKRVLDTLGLLNSAEDKLLVTSIMQERPASAEPFVLLSELGKAIYTSELTHKAWETANK